MKKKTKKGVRRYFSSFLSLCIVLMSFPSAAAEIESAHTTGRFSFKTDSFLASVLDIEKSEEPDDPDQIFWLSSPDEQLESNYQKLLNQPEIYEFFPDYESTEDTDGVDVRTFIRTIEKNWIDGSYHPTGEEKLIFLFTNESGQDVVINANVGAAELPKLKLNAWFQSENLIVEPTEAETVIPEETTGDLNETEVTKPSEETIPAEETNPSASVTESTDEEVTGTEASGKTEEAVTEETKTSSTETAATEAETGTPSTQETVSQELPKEEPNEESKEEPKEESKEEPKEESKEEPKEESKEEPNEEPKEELKEDSQDLPVLSRSAHMVPLVGSSNEKAESVSEDEASEAVKTSKLTGKKLPAIMTEDGYSAVAFVADLEQIMTEETEVDSPYSLNIRHLLMDQGVEYYEEQLVSLEEDDFDQVGLYRLEGEAYTTLGIEVTSAEAEMAVDKGLFLADGENSFTYQVEIHYSISEGYKVLEEDKDVANIEEMAAAKSRERMAALSVNQSIEGFPTITSSDSLVLVAAHNMNYIFSAEQLNSDDDNTDKIINVSEINTIYLYSGNEGNSTGIIVDKSVKDLTFIMGSKDGVSSDPLILDSRGKKQGAVTVEAGAGVTFHLSGDTTLYGGDGYAGLELLNSEQESASVTITGEGSLTSYGGKKGAGIGGGENRANGDLTITGGIITAVGGVGGAGIGGGGGSGSGASYKYKDRSGGSITISGGEIHASGGESAAGIGGGDHGDGGNITIEGTAIIYADGGGGGAGIGSGLGSHRTESGKKGPGYYHGGTISISGNCDITANGGSNGAGIGGGMYGDSGAVVIDGGTITASGLASTVKDTDYQGGAGIGGGYEGHANITIMQGKINAYAKNSDSSSNAAAGIGSGSTPNTRVDRKEKARGPEALYTKTKLIIQGGTIDAFGGSTGGAGIGSGFGADNCEIEISGGTITAQGGPSTREVLTGGAGIGSGCNSLGIKDAYSSETRLNIMIKNGEITSTGGWGASGIGSGADNIRTDFIEINPDSDVTAFADGTKFAVDTYDRTDADAPFVSRDAKTVFQGTFMKFEGIPNYEGLEASIYEDLKKDSGETEISPATEPSESILLPDGYRSFARSMESEADYLINAKKGGFDAKWFVFEQIDADEKKAMENDSHTYHYKTGVTSMSDNYWLFVYKNGDVEEIIPTPPDPQPPVDPTPDPQPPVDPTPDPQPPVDPTPDPQPPVDPTPDPQPPVDPTPDPQPPVTPDPNPPRGDRDDGGDDDDSSTPTISPEQPPAMVTIDPEGVPLAALPPLASDSFFAIDDGQIPLAALPKTGENNNNKELAGIFSGLLMGLYLMFGRKKDNT